MTCKGREHIVFGMHGQPRQHKATSMIAAQLATCALGNDIHISKRTCVDVMIRWCHLRRGPPEYCNTRTLVSTLLSVSLKQYGEMYERNVSGRFVHSNALHFVFNMSSRYLAWLRKRVSGSCLISAGQEINCQRLNWHSCLCIRLRSFASAQKSLWESTEMLPSLQRFLSRRTLTSRAKGSYGDWVKFSKASGTLQEKNVNGKLAINVFGGYADEYDAHRPHYPKRMWDDILKDSSGIGTSVDVAAGTGRGALELARRGFNSIAIDLDLAMLDQISTVANRENISVETIHAPAERTLLPADSADVLVSLQAFHWFDAIKATEEFHRVLKKPNGIACIAWNDRNLEVEWIQELESIIEKYNPLYNRNLKIAERVAQDGCLFEESGHFYVDSLRYYSNPVKMSRRSMLDLLWTFSYVKNAFGDDKQKSTMFEDEVEELLVRHHGEDNTFDLEWICKSYTLRPTPATK